MKREKTITGKLAVKVANQLAELGLFILVNVILISGLRT